MEIQLSYKMKPVFACHFHQGLNSIGLFCRRQEGLSTLCDWLSQRVETGHPWTQSETKNKIMEVGNKLKMSDNIYDPRLHFLFDALYSLV